MLERMSNTSDNEEDFKKRKIQWSETLGYCYQKFSKVRLMLYLMKQSPHKFSEETWKYWIWVLHIALFRDFWIGKVRRVYPTRRYLKEIQLYWEPIEIHFIARDEKYLEKVETNLEVLFEMLGISEFVRYSVLVEDTGRQNLVERVRFR